MSTDTTTSGELFEWEIHLSYDPMETSQSGERTVFVTAKTRENAIRKVRENRGWEDALAYPIYNLGPADQQEGT